VEPEKVITGRAMGSMLGLGACVAVAAWAGGDRDDGPAGPRGIIDDGSILRSLHPDVRTLAAVLADDDAVAALSSLQRRYSLRKVAVVDPSEDEPPACLGGSPGLISVFHDFHFKLPDSTTERSFRVRFTVCEDVEGRLLVQTLSGDTRDLPELPLRAARRPVCHTFEELIVLGRFLRDDLVRRHLAELLSTGTAADLAVRTLDPDDPSTLFEVRVWVSLAGTLPAVEHVFAITVDASREIVEVDYSTPR